MRSLVAGFETTIDRLAGRTQLQVVRQGAGLRPEAFRGIRVLDAAQFLASI